ncbi:hypothetical protein [Bartonella tamiae]|uniref:hypothetical protein n=1 Tax=Bartonella tamiae TaxID=373638 RepID=UPI0002D29653|nr:hypothetical protein [Bartonella tamiae]
MTDTCKLVIDAAKGTVALFMDQWASEKSLLPTDGKGVEATDKHLDKLPIVTGAA